MSELLWPPLHVLRARTLSTFFSNVIDNGAVLLSRAAPELANMFQHHQLRGTHTCAPPVVRQHCRLLTTAAKRSSEMQKTPVVLPGQFACRSSWECMCEDAAGWHRRLCDTLQCCNMLSPEHAPQARPRIRWNGCAMPGTGRLRLSWRRCRSGGCQSQIRPLRWLRNPTAALPRCPSAWRMRGLMP